MSQDIAITCQEMVELMTDYLEGAMTPEDRSRFELHISACDGCRNYLAQIRDTVRLTGMLTEEQVPEDVRGQLLSAFRSWKQSS